jgi:hypothetical protein
MLLNRATGLVEGLTSAISYLLLHLHMWPSHTLSNSSHRRSIRSCALSHTSRALSSALSVYLRPSSRSAPSR